MNIKTGTELIIYPLGSKTHFRSFFVGEKTGVHIVASLPQELPFPDKTLHKGGDVLVQYSEGSSVYEFKSGVKDIIQEPAELLILDYPAETNVSEKRSRKRVNCLIEARFEIIFEENNRLITGVIENISKTGCNCILKKLKGAEQPFSLGDRINLRCQFPGFPGEQTGEGKIIRLQDMPEEINAGIKFDKELWWIPPYGPNA